MLHKKAPANRPGLLHWWGQKLSQSPMSSAAGLAAAGALGGSAGALALGTAVGRWGALDMDWRVCHNSCLSDESLMSLARFVMKAQL